MVKNQLLIASSSGGLSKVRDLFDEGADVSWLYLGKDALKRRSIGLELGAGFKAVDIARVHGEAVNEIRAEHVEWIDGLNASYGDKLEWWFGAVSSRNIYSSNLFQYCAYLEVLERLWKEDKVPALIFTQSRGLSKAVLKWALGKGIEVAVSDNRPSATKGLLSLVKSLRYPIKYLPVLLFRKVSAFATRIICGKEDLTADEHVIVDTFLHDSSISKEGLFKDRYFPHLHEYLAKSGEKVLVHPVIHGYLHNYFSLFRRMRLSDTKFIIAEDYMCISDYIYTLTFIFKLLRMKIETPSFRGFDVSDLLEEDHREQSFFPVMEAAFIYRLFLRLGKAGLRINYVIEWYENQVIDKALVAGVRRALPETKLIGAQIFIHAPNFLNFFPCSSEVKAGMSPDLLLETSERQCDVAQSFTRSIPCKPAAALRYSHLYSETPVTDEASGAEEKIVMALLPFNLTEAVELLEVLSETSAKVAQGVSFSIKCHPDYSGRDLIKAFGESRWPAGFEIFNGDLGGGLESASIVVSSNSSSMVEAAAKGVPVIFIGRQSALNQNLLAGLDIDGLSECFDAKELAREIDRYLALTPSMLREMRSEGKELRDILFKPVSEHTMKTFLLSKPGNDSKTIDSER